MFSRISETQEHSSAPKQVHVVQKEEVSKPNVEVREKPEFKLKQPLPKPVIYLLIVLFAISVIGIIAVVLYINHRNELKKAKTDLDVATHTQNALKEQLEQQNEMYQNLYDEHQQALEQFNEFRSNVTNQQMQEEVTNKPIINVPMYDVGDAVYNEDDPNSVKRKPDPRVEERNNNRKLVQQYRPTVADSQETIKQKIEEQQKENDTKVKEELQQISKGNNVDEDELVDDDELIAVLGH